MAALFRDPGAQRQHRRGPFQRLGLRFFIHAQHHSLVRRIEVEPGDVADLGLQGRSVENLKLSARHGCSPHSRHTSAILTFETPSSAASSRDDQCVTPSRSGGGSRVASTIATSSVVRGLPGSGRSASPPVPSAAYRFFLKITVGLDTPVRRTISFVPIPSPASSTILARWASPARMDVARTHEASTSRLRGGTSTHTVNAITHGHGTSTRGQHTSLTGN